MLLAIDSGNSNVVFAIYEGQTLRGCWRISSDMNRTADEYAVWLTQVLDLAGFRIDQIRDAVIANVMPAAQRPLSLLCRRYFSCDPLMISAEKDDAGQMLDFGFGIQVDTPSEVGPDRLANVAAVNDGSKLPAIVIDFGTATTFDVVDDQGRYRGGAIAPGIDLSIRSLHAAAARLPLIGVGKPKAAIGESTVAAMQSGIYWGYIGMIDGLVERLSADLEPPGSGTFQPYLIATGGLASVFQGVAKSITNIDPDLTLRGLLCLYHRNRRLPT